MTPKDEQRDKATEYAKTIHDILFEGIRGADYELDIEIIVTGIRAAVEESLPYSEHKRKWFNEGHERGYQLGKAEALAEGKRFAYEHAAKMTEPYGDVGREIAADIRALAAKELGE